MKQLIKFMLVCLLTVGITETFSQLKIDKESSGSSYIELADPAITDTNSWAKLKKEINVSFASSNVRFKKSKIPTVPTQTKWSATGWRGEKINTQVLIWTKRAIREARVSFSQLKDNKGNVIGADHLKASFVRYVMTDIYQPDCVKENKTTEIDSSLVADVLDTVETMAISANTVQPVWLSLQIPHDAAPGLYTGLVDIKTETTVRRLRLQINVIDRTLPKPADIGFDLDLWQHPVAIARIHNTGLWTDAHFEAMKPYFEMLAQAGQKVVTAAITHEPWGHQTYDDFPGMIKVIKKADGSWFYDYSLFDKYVNFVQDCGITKRINCYSIMSWDNNYRYYDENTQSDSIFMAHTADKAYKDFWLPLLKDFAAHLKQKNWFAKTSIAMDERPLEDMQRVIKLLHEADADWKIALAGRYHAELINDIYDYAVFKTDRFTSEELLQRKAKGWPSTYYTSCEGNFPNLFTFSSPIEAIYLPYQCAAKGFTGYLRWAYNSWPAQPLLDSRFISWPAGDTFQIYPGPRSSVRFEKLLEGVQDFEKIRILSERYRRENNFEALDKLNMMLQQFESTALIDKHVMELIEKTRRLLNGDN
ncbi:DUF4091 domain-containing protein [Sphingobacterium deserti]|uniref:Uncharacterized protein n=1 Tax=Sphingobacterium deserti TaxID=1229276 RepID=A0A0B8TBL3_9SPHI|nr:DUF4091 domain-containing protein [Sphingobacterium deserti]KGE15620.1 hypothetical protein DI53_0724 [Sphingobacterium deserti]